MIEIKESPVKAIALVLLLMSGGALAAVQPITTLPLWVDAEQRWHLPAGEYRGSFSVDQPMQMFATPARCFRRKGRATA